MNITSELSQIFSSHQIKSDSESLKYYGRDWTTYFDINPSCIVFPETTEQVQKLVLWAKKSKVGLVPSGGRTGLSGGACALNFEVVVSFERMNKIIAFDHFDQIVRCQAGAITEEIQKFAAGKNLFYPVDFAARGSSHIGGNVATNAGGIKVVRYGLTRDWVLSLQVVTGQGEVLELNHGLVKNATGPDLRHLFIGSEGILGFITEVSLKLTKPPKTLQVLLFACPDLNQVMASFAGFKSSVDLCAFEMFSALSLKHVMEAHGLPHPLQSSAPFYVVCEIETSSEAEEQKVLNVFEHLLESGAILDGVISQSEEQAQTLWKYRELISESLAKHSPYKNDIAVRVSQVPAFVSRLEAILLTKYPTWEVVWFGHIGDGNLHINILRPSDLSKEDFVRACQSVDQDIFQCISEFHGSISAEHGVGLTKRPFLHFSRSQEEISYLQQIKKIFDPAGIMNPGKVIL